MIKKAAIALPLALSLSMAAFADPGRNQSTVSSATTQEGLKALDAGFVSAWAPFGAPYLPQDAFQVRIEQRVIVRIAPRSSMPRQSLTAELQERERQVRPRLVEKRMDDCLSISDIAAVQTTRDDRLLLYLRDRRLVSARLEKSCTARDYYSGFYVERNKDGKLCRKRDKLLSRSGANCEIDRLRQLIPDEDN